MPGQSSRHSIIPQVPDAWVHLQQQQQQQLQQEAYYQQQYHQQLQEESYRQQQQQQLPNSTKSLSARSSFHDLQSTHSQHLLDEEGYRQQQHQLQWQQFSPLQAQQSVDGTHPTYRTPAQGSGQPSSNHRSQNMG